MFVCNFTFVSQFYLQHFILQTLREVWFQTGSSHPSFLLHLQHLVILRNKNNLMHPSSNDLGLPVWYLYVYSLCVSFSWTSKICVTVSPAPVLFCVWQIVHSAWLVNHNYVAIHHQAVYNFMRYFKIMNDELGGSGHGLFCSSICMDRMKRNIK
jgi:hypothetical protein